METYTEKAQRAAVMFEQARGMLADEKATDEVRANALQLATDAKKLQGDATQLKELEKAIGQVQAYVQPPTAPPPDTKFSRLGEFLKAARFGNDPRLVRFNDERGESKTALAEAVGATGGFLVPVQYLPQLMGVADPFNEMIRSRASIIPMRGRELEIPVIDQTGTTANQPHWFGGVVASWTEEAAQKSESEPKFRLVKLVAHKLAMFAYASDELLADSAIGLEAFLSGPLGFGGAIKWEEDWCFLNGTGAGQPLGVINAGATISIAAQANPPAPATLYTDLVNMLEAFLPGANGVWLLNQRHLSDLLLMNGPAGTPSYLWGNAVQGMPGTLLGMPVFFTEKLPAPGSAGSIALVDWKYYLIGDRQATTIESSNAPRFIYDQTTWRAVHRVDGQPWLSAPLTLQDGSTQVSPFVILGAKST